MIARDAGSAQGESQANGLGAQPDTGPNPDAGVGRDPEPPSDYASYASSRRADPVQRLNGCWDTAVPGAPLTAADLERDPRSVLTLLEPDQIVAAKKARLGLRPLSPTLRVVLWGLRLYVVFMLVVVGIAVARGLRGAG